MDFANLPGLVMKDIIPWFEAMGEARKFGCQMMNGVATEGTYEMLDYGIQLELVDPVGKRALVHKREKVKYLQNNIVAF